MVTELGRILRVGLQILLDVIARDFLKGVVLRSGRCVQYRQRQEDASGDDDFHPTSARTAAMKNRLRGDLIERELLCLEIGAALIEAGDNHENGSSHEHQNCEEREVLIVGQLACAISVQVPRVKLSNEELAEGDSEKPQRHDGALHRVRGLSV